MEGNVKDPGMTDDLSAAQQCELSLAVQERPRHLGFSPFVEVPSGTVGVAWSGRLRSSAIGSCVCVALCDPVTRVSGLAHLMLPGKAPVDRPCEATKYVEGGIHALLEALPAMGVQRERLVACIAGGGNVLEREDDTLCATNILSVRRTLDRMGIARVAEDVGGILRRSLTVDADSGSVLITIGDSGARVLWEKPAPNAARGDEPDDEQ